MIVNYHFLDTGKDFDYYSVRRSSFQDIYAQLLVSEPLIGGRILDIGCGHGVNPTLSKIMDRLGPIDGVDPFPEIEPPTHLINRWSCSLEDVPVNRDTYDMAYSYNVVEHVENIESFLKKTVDIIKPGGVYWSISPNARHPFTWVTRLAQIFRLKKLYQRRLNSLANEYPACYRLSNDFNILRAIKRMDLPVTKVDFYYVPNVQWDHYFPTPLQWIAHYLDRTFLLRNPKWSFIFMFRLEKNS